MVGHVLDGYLRCYKLDVKSDEEEAEKNQNEEKKRNFTISKTDAFEQQTLRHVVIDENKL